MPDTEVIESAEETETEPEDLVEDELLVEDVSIDGMCGVY
jgi:mycofactocin precursor